jgi:hypothetical protein
MLSVIDTPVQTPELLKNLGVELTPSGDVVMSDFARAENCYIHHSTEPVAAVAFALVSPAFSRGRFPSMRLVDLVTRVPYLDGSGAVALAALVNVEIPSYRSAHLFVEHLHNFIDRYELEAFFVTGQQPIQGIDVRPRGVDWRTEKADPAAMAAWRRAYKNLSPNRQMLVATVIWLYRGRRDKTWMQRLPCSWHSADSIVVLKDAGSLRDWCKLVALYPGW